jgi:hypothetical protein
LASSLIVGAIIGCVAVGLPFLISSHQTSQILATDHEVLFTMLFGWEQEELHFTTFTSIMDEEPIA